MARFGNIGIFAGGLAGGIATGANLARGQKREQREQEAHDLKKQEIERQRQAWTDLAALVDEYNPRQPVVPQMPQAAADPGAVATGMALGANAPNVPARLGVRFMQGPASGAGAPAVDVAVDQLISKQRLTGEEAQRVRDQVGERIVAERISYGMYRNPNLFKNSEFANRAGQIFLKAGMGETGMRWLERGAQAVDENGIDALRRLIGGDVQGAEAAFNATGNVKVKPGSTRDLGNGRYSITLADGQERTIDPRQILRSYLSPRDFFTLEVKEIEAGSREQQRKDTAAGRDRSLTEQERHNRATEGIQRQLADFRAQRGADAETAMVKNIRFMINNGIAKDATEAYGKLRTALEKPEEDAILTVAGNMMRGPGYYGKDGWTKAVRDATKMVRTVKGGGSDAPAAGAPGQAAGTAGAGRSYNVRGKTFSDADIEATARTYGITTDQVKQRLGVR